MINRLGLVSIVLAAAVADAGTVDVAYPAGTSQASFLRGLAGADSYVMLNDNEKLTVAGGDISLAFGASAITITNNSGFTWAVGTGLTLNADRKDGNDIVSISIPVKLARVADGDIVTDFQPGLYGWIESVDFLVTDPVTTAAKASTLNLEIGATNLTGGVLALTSAAATPIGKVINATEITANNYLTPESKISVEAASTTAFAEGEGVLIMRIRRDPVYAA